MSAGAAATAITLYAPFLAAVVLALSAAMNGRAAAGVVT